MSESRKMSLKLHQTGVPGLDEVLNGGLPEYSFNLIVGAPGSGKTTLVHQITFANAAAERTALYFTVVGEPALKMLRYQQQMAFFDPEKAGTSVRFVDLSQQVLTGDLALVLAEIVRHVQDANPTIVVVDSFRSVLRARRRSDDGQLEPQEFVQKLALHLTSWQTTSFLVGEYSEQEVQDNPVFTVADGILWLSQHKERSSMVRKLEVTKMRGVAAVPGLHTFRITEQGVQVFPRVASRSLEAALPSARRARGLRARFGVAALDEMLGGGLPAGDATLVAGPSGTGKTMVCTHFIAEGVRCGEAGVLAIFEEHPDDYLARALQMGLDLPPMVEAGKLKVLYLRPLDLSAEEILFRVQEAVAEVGATRLVIDSLNGVELALAPTFREDFREALYRVVGRLTSGGVSVLMTVEVMESFTEIKFSPHAVSFLAQNIIFLRYVEIEGRLRRVLTVVKMRGSGHSHELREFSVTDSGLRLLGSFGRYQGVLTGVASPLPDPGQRIRPGLDEQAQRLLDRLVETEQLSEEELSQRAGLAGEKLTSALGRLLALNYVVRISESGRTYYRALERPLGHSSP